MVCEVNIKNQFFYDQKNRMRCINSDKNKMYCAFDLIFPKGIPYVCTVHNIYIASQDTKYDDSPHHI